MRTANLNWATQATRLGKKLAVVVAIISALSTIVGAAWSLFEFAKATRERARLAQITQLTTYESFGDLLKRYHTVEKITDDFMRQHRSPNWDMAGLLKEYQTGSSIYFSPELKEFREIHQFYEELGTLVRFRAVDFELVFQTITFPSDFQEATRPLQKFLSDHWFELRNDPKERRLADFGFNLAQLEKNYEARRHESRSYGKSPNPSIERTSNTRIRQLPAAAHVKPQGLPGRRECAASSGRGSSFHSLTMTKLSASGARPPLVVFLGIAVGGIASVVALVAMALVAWEQVRSGRGWETYRTHWLVEFNWIGFLVLLAALGLALVVGLLFRLREWRELKDLERRYGERRHG